MKKIIIAAAIAFTTGILSTFTIKNNVKPTVNKASVVSVTLKNDLATAD